MWSIYDFTKGKQKKIKDMIRSGELSYFFPILSLTSMSSEFVKVRVVEAQLIFSANITSFNKTDFQYCKLIWKAHHIFLHTSPSNSVHIDSLFCT